ncbi:hypothetical protein GCM10009680_43150 [Streptomyces yatensis]|uniref:Uncharacterized protein n=1 Tax=Streptomyces yatensis TaxID=155177 RepID=A0ABP4U4D3_9ACTN
MAAGVIYEGTDGSGEQRFYPKVPAPPPGDVFPLDEEEAAIQRQLRIDSAYEGDSYRIIEVFEPDGQRREEAVTSLDRIARLIKGGPHDALEAIRLPAEVGDFTTRCDLTDLPSRKIFRIQCDPAGIGQITRMRTTFGHDLDVPPVGARASRRGKQTTEAAQQDGRLGMRQAQAAFRLTCHPVRHSHPSDWSPSTAAR